ncbi:MAG: M24 family metallopeptidase [Proteobacteria bacterium]|nr:MAG: M24 family metallopeptidase [Pseudomonadota bacterium]
MKSTGKDSRLSEIEHKIKTIRRILSEENCAGLRLSGADWFSWATAGGSNVILLTTDGGVAEVLVTQDEAFVITDAIEYDRMLDEEVTCGFRFIKHPWQNTNFRETFIKEATHGGLVMSDSAQSRQGEVRLSPSLIQAKRILCPEEIQRYRILGREAAEAMTETLKQAEPSWTGHQLAGRGAEALWKRGIHPALTLVGEERRLPLHRHATASHEPLGSRAMLVFCARRHGLYANLTRFVYFREPNAQEIRAKHDLAAIEAEVFAATRPSTSLGALYEQIAIAYARFGYPDEIMKHHQGGPTGYLAREEVARPESKTRVEDGMAFAWNPSLTGTKIEDTVILNQGKLEIITVDEAFPTFYADDRMRPDYLVRL